MNTYAPRPASIPHEAILWRADVLSPVYTGSAIDHTIYYICHSGRRVFRRGRDSSVYGLRMTVISVLESFQVLRGISCLL